MERHHMRTLSQQRLCAAGFVILRLRRRPSREKTMPPTAFRLSALALVLGSAVSCASAQEVKKADDPAAAKKGDAPAAKKDEGISVVKTKTPPLPPLPATK